MKVGIESISLYVPDYYFDLLDLAALRGLDPKKFYHGLGQEQMAVPPPDEDVVTMAAHAASHALADLDPRSIGTLLFATETGVDQSKAAALYVHRLLGLAPDCMALEVKQACCSGAAALLLALAAVRQQPERKVLLVASDVARYPVGSPGEPTQGAGAAAVVISSTPHLLEVDPRHGVYTTEVMDFWRPNYLAEALVDGKYSLRMYLQTLEHAWGSYVRATRRQLAEHDRFCYHLPFTRMGEKAHAHLWRLHAGRLPSAAMVREAVYGSLAFNRRIGNSYAASLFVALTSLLDSECGLEGRRVALFSYGSGCMGLFFSGVIGAGYRHHVGNGRHRRMLAERESLEAERYQAFTRFRLPEDGSSLRLPRYTRGSFRLAGIAEHQRLYERCTPAPAPGRSERLRAEAFA